MAWINVGNWLLCGPLVGVVFIAVRLVQMRRDVGIRDTGVGVIYGILATSAMFVIMAFGLQVSPSGVLFVPVFISCMFYVIGTTRWRRKVVLLETLLLEVDDAARRRTLTEMANHFGWMGRTARRILGALRRSGDLRRAVESLHIPPGLYHRIRWRMAYRYGSHEAASHSSRDASISISSSQWTLDRMQEEIQRTLGRLFVLLPLLLGLPILPLFFLFVAPVLQSTAIEFNLPSSAVGGFFTSMTTGLESFIARMMNNTRFLAVLVQITLALPVLIVFVMAFLSIMFLPWAGKIMRLPGLRRLLASYDRALGLYVLNQTLRLEGALQPALEQAAEIVESANVAPRFRRACQLLQSGQTAADALVKSKVLTRREANAVSMAETSDELGWGLEQIAQQRIDRLLIRLGNTVQAIIVVAVACGAIIVLDLGSMMFRLLQNIALQLA